MRRSATSVQTGPPSSHQRPPIQSAQSQPILNQSTGPFLNPQQQQTQGNPGQPTTNVHTRSTSFFGFRNKPSGSDSTLRTPARSLSVIAPSTATTATATATATVPPLRQQGTDDFGRPMTSIISSGTAQNGFASNPNSNPTTPPPQGQQLLQAPTGTGMQPTQLHPEIRSVVHLNLAHAHKIYFSGPLVRRIERQPDGQRPAKDEGWADVWGQLGGTTLSVWDMREIAEASKQGKEVPPTYINMTDAFVQVLGSVTVPATASSPAKRYSNVLTLNTAGSNLILFSCPTTISLLSWAAALRLSAWEKSRLEEIYTAHQIRINLGVRDIKTTLIRGQMEGFVRVRVAGQTDWKRMYMVISGGLDSSAESISGADPQKKKRISSLFGRDQGPAASGPVQPRISMFASPKPKDRKKAVLTLTKVTQAFAVYPDRPELIARSTLMKIEGLMGDEQAAGGMRCREGWWMVLPDIEPGSNQAAEMLRWVVATHDAFGLYGRPQSYTWDPRDPASLMFAYPVGPQKDQLFLDRMAAENSDPRVDQTSTVRANLLKTLHEKMRAFEMQGPPKPPGSTPSQPSADQARSTDPSQRPQQQNGTGPQLPPNASNPPFQPNSGTVSVNQPPSQTNVAPASSGPLMQLSARPSQETVQQTAAARTSPAPVPPNRHPDRPVNLPSRPSFESSHSIIRTSDPGAVFASAYGGMSTAPVGKNQDFSDMPQMSSSGPTAQSPTQQVLNYQAPSTQPMVTQLTSTSTMSQSTVPVPLNSVNSTSTFQTLPSPIRPSSADEITNFQNEAGALYYIQNLDRGDSIRQVPSPTQAVEKTTPTVVTTTTPQQASTAPKIDAIRAGSPLAFVDSPTSLGAEPGGSPPRTTLVRKPTGARDTPNIANQQNSRPNTSTSTAAAGQDGKMTAGSSSAEDPTLDALMALKYLNNAEPTQPLVPVHALTPVPAVPMDNAEGVTQYKSSFAPSRQATERKARSQAQQAAHDAAVHKPGRANGKKKAKDGDTGAWGMSSDEEDEDEDDEDEEDEEDVGSKNVRPVAGSSGAHTSTAPAVPPPPPPPPSLITANRMHHSIGANPSPVASTPDATAYSAPKPIRHLPQIPGKPIVDEDYAPPQPRRAFTEQYSESGRRTIYDEGQHIRNQSEFPPPGSARQNVWSQALESGRNGSAVPEPSNNRDTFIQLEPSSHTMTKAFTPQGLLSAGLQDKQDRSAKRQEELARESGASLINVPNKPPPPQTGLLGAITAHERDRKREGGVGATLTERERQKRLAEERQRQFDEQQRQQLEQMAQGGSMFAGQPFPGYNPMMANPMMMGMNPMMAMNPMMTGQMGFPPMIPPYNPQHMYAAQQAAQAYQQAMMAFSATGSQAGGDAAPQNTQTALAPMMTGNMPMFDPRMSMMGMPMMGSPMMGMGMQLTGQGTFDPRFSTYDGLNPHLGGQLGGPPSGHFSSRNSSANGRGSPLALPVDHVDSISRNSRQNSPAPKI